MDSLQSSCDNCIAFVSPSRRPRRKVMRESVEKKNCTFVFQMLLTIMIIIKMALSCTLAPHLGVGKFSSLERH